MSRDILVTRVQTDEIRAGTGGTIKISDSWIATASGINGTATIAGSVDVYVRTSTLPV